MSEEEILEALQQDITEEQQEVTIKCEGGLRLRPMTGSFDG